ncbi:MAG: ABC transporter substrate-binding protein, partial [Ilumatobacteraceae bacterium]
MLLAVTATSGCGSSSAVSSGSTAESSTAESSAAAVLGVWTHAYAAVGQPKYARDFKNVAYVDPAAPNGGT